MALEPTSRFSNVVVDMMFKYIESATEGMIDTDNTEPISVQGGEKVEIVIVENKTLDLMMLVIVAVFVILFICLNGCAVIIYRQFVFHKQLNQ
jgi:hypothetical protein